MPPLRVSSHHGRQKACTECVKAKRRCDIGHPCCARCRRQSLVCIYPQPPTQLPAPSGLGDVQLNEIAMAVTPLQDTDAAMDTFNLEPLGYTAAFDEQLLDFDIPIDVACEGSLDQLDDARTGDKDSLAVYRPHGPTKQSTHLWTNITSSFKSRIGYAIERFKLAPQTMVTKNSTLWCHAMFYDEDMPRLMQDAHAACALYNARNDLNADYVRRHVASRVAELAETPLPTASAAVIARAHALLLYQVMLVFGDDVRSFSQSEAILHHLEQIGCLLLQLSSEQADPSGPLPLYPSTRAHTAWRSYIFRETLRRTVLSLYQFVAICRILFGRLENCAPRLSRGSKVTISAHLWRAESAFEFAMVWNREPHFLVYDLDFTDLLRDGRPDDTDEFAKTMLVGIQGIDDVRGWLYNKGGTL
ncbi:hypothetical protein OPT61_g5038 [Boeremia exigua]|uniref:Uncharacterized protein n=1 Tax=Boeremia exigua TaxID=749465 RepID=A0ACC2IBR2_9PLEO|nr:hypothetical protein OPT61_g5038 [Boeremia exigua]